MSWTAGASSIVITPDGPCWLAGYAARTEPARGKISDLYARALAIEDEAGGQLLIVTADLIALPRWLVDPVAEKITERFGLPRHRMLFCASHTHYGPEVRPDKVFFFKIPETFAAKIEPYDEFLRAKLEAVMASALEQRAPAEIFFGKTSIDFSHNRRPHGDIHDHDVPVLDVRGTDGERQAIVFGYACHNTCIPHEDRRYCGDWSGFACEHLEREHPGATALFLTGAGADQNADPRGSLELSRQYGRALADVVNDCLAAPLQAVRGSLTVAVDEVPLAFQPVTHQSLAADRASHDPPRIRKAEYLESVLKRDGSLPADHPYVIQAIALGDLLLIALSSEPVVDWSLKLKSQFAGLVKLVWIAGYCNDMFCYLPTRRVQAEGGYEGGRATLWGWVPGPFTDDVEDRVSRALTSTVKHVLSDEE